ncbi:uncharacterized protein LOC129593064 [Paramacrobiotus metropolitanus]|uniref:uncharacterized protein LOC129593064 n=1 Tax=Paramacrobiotus metropolitanus TaxID=2943436 RepID=UPI002445B094|nr:uncharacterized protein LOC129593064 [Paramacrobiotus metropolitanus]
MRKLVLVLLFVDQADGNMGCVRRATVKPNQSGRFRMLYFMEPDETRIQQLPSEILSQVLQNLDSLHRCDMRTVCRAWSYILTTLDISTQLYLVYHGRFLLDDSMPDVYRNAACASQLWGRTIVLTGRRCPVPYRNPVSVTISF